MSLERETKNVDAFELVTQTLKHLDAFIAADPGVDEKDADKHAKAIADTAADPGVDEKGADKHAKAIAELRAANLLLLKALAIDPDYFKAKYLRAMIKYLSDSKVPEDGKSPAEQFEALSKEELLDPIERKEIHYNRGAALFEAGDHVKAIAEFEEASAGTQREPELHLLATAGVALALAKRAVKDKTAKDIAEVNRLYRYVIRKLFADFLKRLLNYKSIDRKVARKIYRLVKEARDAIKSIDTSEPRPTGETGELALDKH